ncbi:hypothetical protein C3Y87_18645 [Carbonactinospora thermoautotrophica]|uniref:hypothetical protein n=1 Tax=Carbonactinospora thermoautotrophica TaxID=1469144 RepID=UPI002271D32E|nr:hypothetical protein [Carbonactinospora thermoautotrophica]MCX9193383.1 hypothetical protein [Carbonactinospora thermoautotrophica]
MPNLAECLEDLIGLRLPFTRLVEELGEFPLESDRPLVVLDPIQVSYVLWRFMSGELNDVEVRRWAHLVMDRREEIAFVPEAELESLVSSLADGLVIGEALDDHLARYLIEELRRM